MLTTTMSNLKVICSSIFLLILAIGCSDNTTPPTDSDNFDRNLMLTHWADNIIILAYSEYKTKSEEMHEAVSAFVESPEESTLTTVRQKWLDAYIAYQKVGMYQVGPDQENNVINLTNIYPADTEMIDDHAENNDFNLNLPSTFAAQGYPAMEYLLYGKTDDEVLAFYTDNENHCNHLLSLSQTLSSKSTNMYEGWVTEYREIFINLDGSSATASVNNIANKYVEYFERHLRANKVGIPSGVFSLDPLPTKVEGRYADGISKILFLTSLNSFQNFFNGQFDANDTTGKGFYEYLTYLDKQSIADDINNQLNSAREFADMVLDDFEEQVSTDNTKMLGLYDELQKSVVLLKVDMMQALNIKVAYVDADGD